MATRPEDFLDFAESALAGASCEFDHRNCASRAYYGVFHLARNSASKLGLPTYEGSSHKMLAESFKNHKHLRIAYMLTARHRERCSADYDIHMHFTVDQAKKVLESCRLLAKELP